MFGLDLKALVIGILLGWFLLPYLIGFATNFVGKKD